MSRDARTPEYLTTVAIPAETVAELGFGVEASVSATGEVGLLASHAPYLFSVHLPAGDDAGRLNLGAFDDARREVSIKTVQRAIDVACAAGAGRGVIHSMGIVSFEGEEVGEAGHAWVQLLAPDGWHGFDPSNNAPQDGRYVVTAVGRDYDDIAPLRGAFTGVANEYWTAVVRVRSGAATQEQDQQ